MRGEAFALTSPLRGFSLKASSCHAEIYRIERPDRSVNALADTSVSVVSANTGAVAARQLQVDSTLRAGGGPGALRSRSEQERR